MARSGRVQHPRQKEKKIQRQGTFGELHTGSTGSLKLSQGLRLIHRQESYHECHTKEF